MERITVESRDLFDVAVVLARKYRDDWVRVYDSDIEAAYSALCALPQLYSPVYLMAGAKEIRDRKERNETQRRRF